MAKTPSLVYQNEKAIKVIIAIGESKRDGKNKGIYTEKIYSYKTIQNTLSVCNDFARFCKKEFKIKYIYDYKVEHYLAYLQQKFNENCSIGHLKNIETGLKKLQIAMRKQAEKNLKTPIIFCPEERVYNSKINKSISIDRSVTREEAQYIINNIKSEEVKNALKLQLNLGLRARESVKLKPAHVDLLNGEINIKSGKGITKGGRARVIEIPDEFKDELRTMIIDVPLDKPIVNIPIDRVRKSLLRKGRKLVVKTSGCHMFRHTFARERFNSLLGDDVDEGRVLLNYMLKQRSLGRRPHNGITKEYREIYQKVQMAMNIVHSELGHGKCRYDLAEVYLK